MRIAIMMLVLVILAPTTVFAQDVRGGWVSSKPSAPQRIEDVDMAAVLAMGTKIVADCPKAAKEWADWVLEWQRWDKENPFDTGKIDRLNKDFWDAHEGHLKDLSALALGWWEARLNVDVQAFSVVYASVVQYLYWTVQYVSDFYRGATDKAAKRMLCEVAWKRGKIASIAFDYESHQQIWLLMDMIERK